MEKCYYEFNINSADVLSVNCTDEFKSIKSGHMFNFHIDDSKRFFTEKFYNIISEFNPVCTLVFVRNFSLPEHYGAHIDTYYDRNKNLIKLPYALNAVIGDSSKMLWYTPKENTTFFTGKTMAATDYQKYRISDLNLIDEYSNFDKLVLVRTDIPHSIETRSNRVCFSIRFINKLDFDQAKKVFTDIFNKYYHD